MSKNQLFEMSQDQKKIIQDISSICGVKQDIVMQVWKYTLLLNYINLLDKKNSASSVLQIPLVGRIWTHIKEDGEVESSVYLTEQLINTMKKIKAGDRTDIVKYFTQEFIDPVIQEILEQ